MARLAIGATLRRALELCRAEWRALYTLALLVEVPVVIADAASIHFLDIEVGGHGPSGDALLAGALLLLWTTLAHHALLAGVEEVEGARRRGEERVTIISVLRALPLLRLLAADLLITLLFVIGLVFLIIPGLVVLVFTTPVFPLLSMEQRSVRETMRRSVQIVRGNAWRLFVIIASIWLASQVAGELVTFIFDYESWVSTVMHHVVVLLIEPLSAATVVVATYELVTIDGARRREPAATG